MTELNSFNIDQWLFDYFEGNLSPLQEQKVEMFIFEHPDYEVDMDTWSNSRASSSIDYYPGAEKLKRKRAGFIFWMRSSAALLLLFIFVGAYFLIQQMNKNVDQQSTSTNLFLQTINNLAIANSKNNNSTLQNNGLYANSTQASTHNNLLSQHNSSAQKTISQNIKNKHTKPVLLANQSTNQSLSNSSSNGWRNTEKLTTTTSKSSLGNSENEFPKDILAVKASLVKPPIQIKNSNLVEAALLAPKSDLSTSKNEEKSKTNHWFSKISRKIKDMANSELALRNLRDPQYIIPGLTQRDINFGSTGGLLATRVQSFSRAQWVGKNDQSVDIRLAADGYVQALHGGIGVQVGYSNYKAGILQNYEAALTYSPKFKLSNNFTLEPAVRFKMGVKDLNNNRVIPGLQSEWDRANVHTFSNVGQQNMSRLWYKDIGVGVMLNAKWFFAGVNLDNLARHSENLYSGDAQNVARTPFNFTATLGTDYESMSKKVALSSYLIYQNFGKRNEGWLGLTFRYQWLTVGGALSTGLDPVASVGIKFNHFMLTYSMDYTKNHIQNDRYLSYQLSLRFVTKQNQYGRKFTH